MAIFEPIYGQTLQVSNEAVIQTKGNVLAASPNLMWIVYATRPDTLQLAKYDQQFPTWEDAEIIGQTIDKLQSVAVTNGGNVFIAEKNSTALKGYLINRYNPVVSGTPHNGKKVTRGRLHSQKIIGIMAVQNMPRAVLTWSADGSARVWNSDQRLGHAIYSLVSIKRPGFFMTPTSVAMNRGNAIVGFSDGSLCYAENAFYKKEKKQFYAGKKPIDGVSFSPEGLRYGAASTNFVEMGKLNVDASWKAKVAKLVKVIGVGWYHDYFYVAGLDTWATGSIRFYKEGKKHVLEEAFVLKYASAYPCKVFNSGARFVTLINDHRIHAFTLQ